MNKIKIILSTIALLGVTGSIFAYKNSKHTGTAPYYITTVQNAAACLTYTRGILSGIGGSGTLYFFTKAKCNPASELGVVTKGV